jgi:hypothetical protein
MIKLETLYRSNSPIDCHILKGRLECDGIDCFIFDENIVWVHPFRAVAIGGVKLKVPSDQLDLAKEILKQINKGYLFDENGKYEIANILHSEYEKQMEVLRIKSEIEYYLDKEIVANYKSKSLSDFAEICPNCNSTNTRNGYAIDYQWDMLYLILSLFLFVPFPLIRKKIHCFDCGFDFKKQKAAANKSSRCTTS